MSPGMKLGARVKTSMLLNSLKQQLTKFLLSTVSCISHIFPVFVLVRRSRLGVHQKAVCHPKQIMLMAVEQ
jgi:hypothetical protein